MLLVRVIEGDTGQTWDALRDTLEQIRRVDLRSKDGRVRVVTELTADQRLSLKKLKIPPPKKIQTADLGA